MNRRGQTILEYMILIGFVVMAVYLMGPAIKRGLQSVVKVTADQIGNQADADQSIKRRMDPNSGLAILPTEGQDDSFVNSVFSNTATTGSKYTTDRIYAVNVDVDETTQSSSNSTTDMGFTKN